MNINLIIFSVLVITVACFYGQSRSLKLEVSELSIYKAQYEKLLESNEVKDAINRLSNNDVDDELLEYFRN